MSNPNIEKWLEQLKQAEKTCLIQDGKRKVHFTFADKTELAEEYNLQNNEIIVRKWRKKNTLGAQLPWVFEIGQNLDNTNINNDIKESSTNPVFVRQDTLKAFQWRIRNLPYTLDNYELSTADENKAIVIRTKNKKYYKKFTIEDMDRVGMKLTPSSLTYSHANNTLIIAYEKPNEIIQMEKVILNELINKTKPVNSGGSGVGGGDDCKPS